MAREEYSLAYVGTPREADRRATWRSVAAGYVLVASAFAILVAVSQPVPTAAALGVGVGVYAFRSLVGRTTIERRFQLCGPRFCLQFRLSVG